MDKKLKQISDKSCTLIAEILQINISDEHVFQKIFGCIQECVKFDAATFYMLNADTSKLKKVVSIKQDVEILADIGDGLSGYLADSGTPLLISDRTKKSTYDPDNDFASFLSVPISDDTSLYGVLNFGSFTKGLFTQDDLSLIQTLSSVLAKYVEYYKLSDNFNELKEAQLQSIIKLAELKKQSIVDTTVEEISKETAEVIHGINNSLSIIIGNLQCLLIGKNDFNQKSLARLLRIEVAAKKISESNIQIMNLNSLVNHQSENNPELI